MFARVWLLPVCTDVEMPPLVVVAVELTETAGTSCG